MKFFVKIQKKYWGGGWGGGGFGRGGEVMVDVNREVNFL